MARLNAYFSRNAFENLKVYLTEAQTSCVSAIVGLMDSDGKADFDAVKAKIFPFAGKNSNAQFKRLQSQVNDIARDRNMAFEIVYSNESGKNFIFFEGLVPSPALANTNELSAIPTSQLVENQLGIPIVDAPVLVLLTFNEYETLGVLRHFSAVAQPPIEVRDGITYGDLGIHGGMRVIHRISKQGEGEAQNSARDAIEAWNPRAIIAVGIAFGMNQAKQNIGDVLVSEYIKFYELTRVNADNSVTIRGGKPAASDRLYNRFTHVDQNRKADPLQKYCWPKIIFGTVLSGNKLVDNFDYRASLLRLEPEAIGGEMEATGVQLAADRKDVDWIVVKAICDWGDGKKNSVTKANDQRIAGEHAALVVKAALDLGCIYGGKVGTGKGGKRQVPTDGFFLSSALQPPSFKQMNSWDSSSIPESQWVKDIAGIPTNLHKDVPSFERPRNDGGVEVLPYLMEWVLSSESPPLFALMGEYGMGKTVTCQKLSWLLDQKLQNDSATPIPLYFDLRNVTNLDSRIPTLRQTLEECMERGWQIVGNAMPYRLEDVFSWMLRGAVIVLDGLDEVLVKLKESDGQVFTNNLLKLVADARHHKVANEKIRVLISCRTQYFRTLRDQKNHFTGQERGDIRSESFKALILLPLTEKQVLTYLERCEGGKSANKMLEMIRSIHNLEELTQRPYTLKLVSEFIPEIEADQIAGKKVYGVTLYRKMVMRWLERDSGKHHILPRHKLRIAESLAAYFWREAQNALDIMKIEAWFHNWLSGQSDIAGRYRNLHPDQLEEDLRTATFLARQDDNGKSTFRFAHTSLQEFFLAEYLLNAMRRGEFSGWAMPRPSFETLKFLSEMLQEDEDRNLINILESWKFKFVPQASELLLHYAALAFSQAWLKPDLRNSCFEGVQISKWRLGTELFSGDLAKKKHHFDLSGSSFRHAKLNQCEFLNIDFSNVDFEGANLGYSIFDNCSMRSARLSCVNLVATTFRNCDFSGSVLNDVVTYSTNFIECTGAGEDLPAGSIISPKRFSDATVENEKMITLQWYPDMPPAATRDCQVSHDGRRVVSAGADGALRVHDVRSGQLEMTLVGCGDSAFCCSWSPDGKWIAAGGPEGKLIIWNAFTGDFHAIGSIHKSLITSCEWAPSAALILSLDEEGCVRIWNLDREVEVAFPGVLVDDISSVTWSVDANHIIAGTQNGSIVLYNLGLGRQEAKYDGEGEAILGMSRAPSGDGLAVIAEGGQIALLSVHDLSLRKKVVFDAETLVSVSWSRWADRLLVVSNEGRVIIVTSDNLMKLKTLESSEVSEYGPGAAGWISRDELFIGSLDDGFRVVNFSDGEEVYQLSTTTIRQTICDWASDSKIYLSTVTNGMLFLWAANSHKIIGAIDVGDDYILMAKFLRGSKGILTITTAGEISIWNLSAKPEKYFFFRTPAGPVLSASLHPDEHVVAFIGSDKRLHAVSLKDGALQTSIPFSEKNASDVSWSPDGTRLAVVVNKTDVVIVKADTGRVLRRLDADNEEINTISWSPDGNQVAVGSDDGAVRIWSTKRRGQPIVLHDGASWVLACAWSPNGKEIAAAGFDTHVRVWDIEGKLLHKMSGNLDWVRACTWHPDGKHLLTACDDSTVRLWNTEHGKALVVHGLTRRGHAVWDVEKGEVVEQGGDAWRCLGWKTIDSIGKVGRKPVEYGSSESAS